MLIRLRKSQASLEYAALIGVVVGAIILMSTYMKRSVQGSLRENSDSIGDQYDYTDGSYQYSSTLDGTETTITEVTTDGTDANAGLTAQQKTGADRKATETITAN